MFNTKVQIGEMLNGMWDIHSAEGKIQDIDYCDLTWTARTDWLFTYINRN